jgi:hypothetical protein
MIQLVQSKGDAVDGSDEPLGTLFFSLLSLNFLSIERYWCGRYRGLSKNQG